MLHSIYLDNHKVDAISELPDKIRTNIKSFVSCCGQEGSHTLYTDCLLRDFIKCKFDNDVAEAYDDLIPLAYKADLGRYCLLYELGGAYSDLSVFFHDSFFDQNNLRKLHVFRDAFSGAPWIVSNSIIAAPARLSIFENCIKKIVEHTRTNYYGNNALCPTGPHLLGAELAKSVPLGDIACGETIRLPNRNGVHNFAYVNKSGEFMAINYKKGYGIGSLGAIHGESYLAAYNRRAIYKGKQSRELPPQTYTADSEVAVIENLTVLLNALLKFIPQSILRSLAEALCTIGRKTNSTWIFNSGGIIFVFIDTRNQISRQYDQQTHNNTL